MSKKVASCTAVARGRRIEFIIRKGERGYKAFAKLLTELGRYNAFSWYGDVRTINGVEQSGLILTTPIS